MSNQFYETTLTFDFIDKNIKPLLINVKKMKSEIPLKNIESYEIPLEYKLKVDDLIEAENQVKEYLRQYNSELEYYGYIGMSLEHLSELYLKFDYLISEKYTSLQFDVITYKLINNAVDFYNKYLRSNEYNATRMSVKKPVSTLNSGNSNGIEVNYNRLSEQEKEKLKKKMESVLILRRTNIDNNFKDDNNDIYFSESITIGDIIYPSKVEIYNISSIFFFCIECLFETACEAYIEIQNLEGQTITKDDCKEYITHYDKGKDNIEFIHLVFGDLYTDLPLGIINPDYSYILSEPKFVELQKKYYEILLKKFNSEEIVEKYNLIPIRSRYYEKYLKYKSKYIELKKMSN